MAKDISQMSDHELLMELIADRRGQDKLRYVKYGIVAVILVAVIVELFIKVLAENPLIFSRWDECQQAIAGNIKKEP